MKIGITERGDAGYHFTQWLNKINSVEAAVLITKRPDLLVKRINEIPNNTIIHCTITGAGKLWEPNGIPTEDAFKAYCTLANTFGYNRVVLRIDPIIPTEWKAVENLLLKAHTNNPDCRIRISILDMYNHVYARLQKYPDLLKKIKMYYTKKFHANNNTRNFIMENVFTIFPNTEVCSEPGYPSTGCVSLTDLTILGIRHPPVFPNHQRPLCECIGQKTELLTHRGQCPNKCLYCYWR
jgi:DNA repair photolyase